MVNPKLREFAAQLAIPDHYLRVPDEENDELVSVDFRSGLLLFNEDGQIRASVQHIMKPLGIRKVEIHVPQILIDHFEHEMANGAEGVGVATRWSVHAKPGEIPVVTISYSEDAKLKVNGLSALREHALKLLNQRGVVTCAVKLEPSSSSNSGAPLPPYVLMRPIQLLQPVSAGHLHSSLQAKYGVSTEDVERLLDVLRRQRLVVRESDPLNPQLEATYSLSLAGHQSLSHVRARSSPDASRLLALVSRLR